MITHSLTRNFEYVLVYNIYLSNIYSLSLFFQLLIDVFLYIDNYFLNSFLLLDFILHLAAVYSHFEICSIFILYIDYVYTFM